jgi:chromosome segregation ATPase
MNDRIEKLAREYARLRNHRDALQEQMDEITAELREAGRGVVRAGNHTVRVGPNRRLNDAKVARRYPISRYPQLYAPSSTKIRQHLAPAIVERLMHEVGKDRVTVS